MLSRSLTIDISAPENGWQRASWSCTRCAKSGNLQLAYSGSFEERIQWVIDNHALLSPDCVRILGLHQLNVTIQARAIGGAM